MTVSALRVYAWPHNLLSSATAVQPDGYTSTDPTYDHDYAIDRNPGHACRLAPWFVVRQFGDPGPSSNHIYWSTPTGHAATYDANLIAGGYNPVGLADMIEPRVSISGLSLDYSTTTLRWTVSAAVTFDLKIMDSESQLLMAMLGFSADQTGSDSYTGDPVFCEDAQPLIWDLGARGSALKCVMIYADPNMVGSADTITCYASNANLGGDWRKWDADAAYVGAEQALRDNSVNHLHLWFPEDDGQTGGLRYWAFFVKRQAAASAASLSAIGVAGIWDDAWYEDEYSFSAPWIPSLIDAETAMMSPAGGGYTRSAGRDSLRILLPFHDWPGATYRELARLRTKHGKDPHLFVADASSVVVDNAVFGVIDRLDGPQYHDVEEIADFTMEIQQVPMAPRGPVT